MALNFVSSAEKHFCANRRSAIKVTYFLISDQEVDQKMYPSVHVIKETKKGWPLDSLYRFKYIQTHAQKMGLEKRDYALWFDADFRMNADACYEMLVCIRTRRLSTANHINMKKL